MAGIKISKAEQVTSKEVVGQHKIPCATGDGSAKCITVDALFDYIEQNLGLTSIPVFSEEKSYKAPDLVKYNGLLYQFIATKEAGPWDVTKAQQTSVFAQLTTLRMGDDEQVQVTISSADGLLNVEGLDVLCEYCGRHSHGNARKLWQFKPCTDSRIAEMFQRMRLKTV